MTKTMTSQYPVVDDALMDHIAELPPEEARDYLFLAPHPKFAGRWYVDCLNSTFFLDFEEIIGKFRTVSPASLQEFLDHAESLKYKVVFEEDPLAILSAWEHLNDRPEFSLNSSMEGVVNGMLPFQLQGFNYLRRAPKGGLAIWSTGPQPVDEPTLTPSGWTRFDSLQVGSEVVGSDGLPHSVTGVYPQGVNGVYELEFRDGSKARSTEDHLWGLFDNNGSYQVRPLSEFMKGELFHAPRPRGDRQAKWFVDRVSAVQGPEQKFPVDPYLLGALLGDGSLTASTVQFYSHEGELVEYIRPCLPDGITISKYGPKHFALVGSNGRNALKDALKDIGVWGHKADTKFIPEIYKRGSIEQRVSLLQGLLDTDGNCEKQSARMFTISERLATDVVELVRSLGGRATKSARLARRSEIQGKIYDCKPGWVLGLTLPQEIEPFRLSRKRIPIRPPLRRNALVSIRHLGLFETQCISVDAEDQRYVTRDYVLTHNTGKTALETALFKQHLEHEDYEVGLVVCKRNNKTDTQRKLLQLGSIDYSYIFEGTPKQREKIYDAFLQALSEGEKLIGITNYEKFRDDPEFFEELFDGRKIIVVWDEMPTKLSNRTTILYDSVRSALYEGGAAVHWEDKRPEALRQYDLTATPIENSPVGVLNQVRLIDPDVWPTIKDWERSYVSGRNFFSREPEDFKDLDRMGLEIEFMTHQVDKRDPDIAKLFPDVNERTIIVDWSPEDRRVYEQLQKIAIELAKEAKKDPEVNSLNPLALIRVLQMLCDAPSMVQKSGENRDEFEAALAEIEDEEEALNYQKNLSGSAAASILLDRLKKPLTNENCNKMKELHDLITVTEKDRKGIVFTKFSTYLLPILGAEFEKWGVTYVTFRGNDKQRQEAVDSFRDDPSIQIFLSSDAGSDSIDLPQAHWTLDYDLPPTYARKVQRRNRAHRINSWHEYVTHYGLQMPNSVEDRWAEILERKQGYHEGVFGGVINESAQSSRMTGAEMWFVLTGESD